MATPFRLSTEERRLRASLAAHTAHAKHGSAAMTWAAQKAFLEKFEKEVDPDGVLSSEERSKRAENARKAHMTRLSYRAVRAARAAREAEAAEEAAAIAEGDR